MQFNCCIQQAITKCCKEWEWVGREYLGIMRGRKLALALRVAAY